ncbi:MAG: translation elongation factor Ts, partial [Lentisphaeria bacterium]|nr:translation elongation factor Ts [Lentisphaeria bacterium]
VGVAVEVLCETDFVAKTEAFKAFCDGLLGRVFADYDDDGIISEKVTEAEQTTLTGLIGTIGENMQVRRTARWTGDNTLASYIHMNGNIGVMIEVEGESDDELLHNICLHIAAFNPRYITPEEVSESVLEKEREIAAAQAEGKPENIIDKIVMGKINKWYSEVCLARQPWIRDDKTSLAKIAPKMTVKRFIRWQVGEEL